MPRKALEKYSLMLFGIKHNCRFINARFDLSLSSRRHEITMTFNDAYGQSIFPPKAVPSDRDILEEDLIIDLMTIYVGP